MTRASMMIPANGRCESGSSGGRRHLGVRLGRVALAGAAALLAASTAFAAQIHWEKPARIGVGQPTTLDLVFDGVEPSGRVNFPRIDGLSLMGTPSQGSNVSIVNGRTHATFTLSYPVRAEREGDILIPPFTVDTDQGTMSVPGTSLTVGKATLPSASSSRAQAAVTAQIATSERKPYAGEVFDVDVLIGLNGARHGEIVGKPTWENQDVVVEPWRDAEQVRGTGSVRLSTRAMAPKAGAVTMARVRQEMNVSSDRPQSDPFAALRNGRFNSLFDDDSLLDSFFGHGEMTNVTVSTDPVVLDVQPLPKSPAGFAGAVGQFTLESKMVPEKPKTGEPVTWTLTLRGTGNWPAGVSLPAREIPNDFRALQPKQKRDFADNEIFTGAVSEDLVLVPTKPGTYHLPPVHFSYFDPDKNAYETAEVVPPVMEISGSPIADTAPAQNRGQSLANTATGPQQSAAKQSVPLPLAPSADQGTVPLPHDPLHRAAASSHAPMSAQRLMAYASIPLVLVAAYWLFLAFRHSRLTDPQRRRREALAQLRAAIADTRRAGSVTERAAAVLAWQQAAAVLLELDAAAPTPAHLRRRTAGDEQGEWAALWAESDGMLYGRDGTLDNAWCERATKAGRRIRRPRHNPLKALLPENLVPRAAAVLVFVIAVAGSVRAEEPAPAPQAPVTPANAYAQGDFTAAQRGWRAQVTADPSNWVARYNLGLADGQLGAPGHALGETAAAFLHQPINESVRWNLSAFMARVPGTDPVLRALTAAAVEVRLARLASPFSWQMALLTGVVVFSVGGLLALSRLYGSTARSTAWAAAPLVCGALISLAAAMSLHLYGPLAAPNTALVAHQAVLRSVPTDAQDTQQHRAVTAGTVVVSDKNFLGWTKVTLTNGESGWLRTADLVPFYTAPEFKSA